MISCPHIAIHYDAFGGDSKEDLQVFTGKTTNANAKSSKKFVSPDQNWPNFGGSRGWGQMVQKVSIFTPKDASLPESASFKPFCVTIG